MSRRWHTVIIGAGIGGLTAAAKLVKSGQHVLVLDRNPHPGGTAYVYQRRGFTFPMGPLGFSNRKIVEDILEDLGAVSNLTWKRVNYGLRAFNLSILLSLPFPEITKELTNEFPDESGAIASFFRDIDKIVSCLQCPSMTIESIPTKRYLQVSATEYLNALVNDWRLRRILGSIGTREPYTSLSLQAAMWNLMSQEGIWYPEEGLTSFCNSLVQAVTTHTECNTLEEAHNKATGIVKLGVEVKRIRVENGRVAGVLLADDTAIDSTFVISNADYKTTFVKLLGPDVSDEWYKAVSQAKQAESVLQVCLGLNKKLIDISAFTEASRLIYRRTGLCCPPDDNINWNVEQVDPEALTSQELEISLWSNEDPNLSPDGGAVVVIRTEAPYSHFARFHLGRGRRNPEYLEYKARLGRALIDEAKNLIPGLEDAIIVMDVATPLTFEDQGGRSEGAVAGWSWNYKDFHDYRPKELVLTPIKGLYMAGYQAFSALFMGGIPTAMVSGCRAAEAVLSNAEPVHEINLHPAKV
jgi:phytoene dehydrogenase-like protein